ncbi:hypothetical protein [Streptomyces sp. cg35]|uniref:hypothetical protein n=1 Tax=Streptomyces sp. cg35 TaxID=3421650 RepID=UPI003D17DA18
MTPAEEITAAADKLRDARFTGAMTMTPTVAALVAAREPIATLLEGVLSSNREAGPAHEECDSRCSPDTCDLSAALAVARAINGSQS